MKSFGVGVLHRSAFREPGRFPPQIQLHSVTLDRQSNKCDRCQDGHLRLYCVWCRSNPPAPLARVSISFLLFVGGYGGSRSSEYDENPRVEYGEQEANEFQGSKCFQTSAQKFGFETHANRSRSLTACS